MIRLYRKELKKLKTNQKLASVTFLENGERIFKYYKYIKTDTLKDPIYSNKGDFLLLKNLKTNEDEYFFIETIGKKNQQKWNVIYERNDGNWYYVTKKYLAKLSVTDQSNMIAYILS